MLWDLTEGRHLSSLDAGDTIHALVFSPVRYWLCAATASTIKIWDLESKNCVAELKREFPPSPQEQGDPDSVHLPGLVCRWQHFIRWLHRQRHSSVERFQA